MSMQGDYDSRRTYRSRSHTSFAIVPTKFVSIKDSAILEGKKLPIAAR
jgi:hypothetical protein